MKDLVPIHKPITITFYESAQEEIEQLTEEMELWKTIQMLHDGEELTPKLRQNLLGISLLFADIINTGLPAIDIDPQVTLQVINRDFKLGKILKEKGMFRLFRLAKQTVNLDLTTNQVLSDNEAELIRKDYPESIAKVPAYTTLINPDTNEPFKTQEEFVGWFCREAHVSRGVVFGRMAMIRKILNLGVSLEKAFSIIVTKPTTIRNILDEVVETWDNGRISKVDPDIAVQVAQKLSPNVDSVLEIAEIATEAKLNPENEEAQQQLIEHYKPLVTQLLDEAAANPSSIDAMDWVTRDVLLQPEIDYYFDEKTSALKVEYTIYKHDMDGLRYKEDVKYILFIPETPLEVPKDVIIDLVTRLPIKNRSMLEVLKE